MANERIWAPWRLRYVKDANQQSGCIFCAKPDEGDDRQALIVHRGERSFVILNLFPYTNGHLMVAPFEHLGAAGDRRRDDRGDDEPGASGDDRLEDVYWPEGFNLGINQGRVGGSRGRGPHPPPRRPALGRRQQLHAGRRGHQGDAAVAGGELRRARGRLRDERRRERARCRRGIFKAYDVRGLYGSEMDGETA